MIIKISNWEKYHPRKDYKSIPWIRVNSDLFFSESMHELDSQEIAVWIFVLCMAAMKQKDTIKVNYSYIVTHCKTTHVKIESALRKLEENQCIEVSRTSHERDTNVSRTDPFATNERTNERKGSIRAPRSTFDFEIVYKNYPKRDGAQRKQSGMKSLSAKIKTVEQYDRFKTAVEKYSKHCVVSKKVGTPLVQQWATFVNNWEEWVDYSPSPAQVPFRRIMNSKSREEKTS